MLHGWVYIKTKIERTIPFMCEELNFHIERVTQYCKKNKIDYNIDSHFDAKTVDPRSTKQNTHHFEILIGQIWNVLNIGINLISPSIQC